MTSTLRVRGWGSRLLEGDAYEGNGQVRQAGSYRRDLLGLSRYSRG